MRPRDVRMYLSDIERSCEAILEFTQGTTLEDYELDRLLRSAVERQFTIAGEALNLALSAEPALIERIHDASEIIGFRNLLVHGYAEVDDERVWRTVAEDVPRLLSEAEALLRERG